MTVRPFDASFRSFRRSLLRAVGGGIGSASLSREGDYSVSEVRRCELVGGASDFCAPPIPCAPELHSSFQTGLTPDRPHTTGGCHELRTHRRIVSPLCGRRSQHRSVLPFFRSAHPQTQNRLVLKPAPEPAPQPELPQRKHQKLRLKAWGIHRLRKRPSRTCSLNLFPSPGRCRLTPILS